MKILWVSPRWALPADTGAKKATLAIIEELVPAAKAVSLNLELNILSLYEEAPTKQNIQELESRTQSKNNLFLQKSPLIFGSTGLTYFVERLKSPKMPFTFARCTSPEIKSEISRWSKDQKWDFTIIDGLHAAAFIDLKDPKYGKFIYRAHNVEADLWKQLITKEKKIFKRSAIAREYKLCSRYEAYVSGLSEKVLTVSETDAERFKLLKFSDKVESLPIGISFKDTPLAMPKENSVLKLLFVGRLDWVPNKEGLLWFLNEVWPNLKNQNRFNLTIIGSGDSEYLSSYVDDRVTLLRNVPDLKPYYAKSNITLIPLFMGSGTRVKAIESGCYGRSFISTAIGVEGLPFTPNQDYFSVETKQQWLEVLNSLSYQQTLDKASRIHEITAKFFDQKNLAENLLKIISKLS